MSTIEMMSLTAPTVALQVTPFLTETQAAARLGLAPKTLRNWRSRGDGPGYLRLGSVIRYHLEELDGWALAQAVAA